MTKRRNLLRMLCLCLMAALLLSMVPATASAASSKEIQAEIDKDQVVIGMLQ